MNGAAFSVETVIYDSNRRFLFEIAAVSCEEDFPIITGNRNFFYRINSV